MPEPTLEQMARRIAGECLALRARRLDRLVTRTFDEALRPHGVGTAQLNLLVGIAVAGPIRAADLGRTLDLEKSTLSRNLGLLVESGWVKDSRDLELTSSGRRLLERVFPTWEATQSALKERLGANAAPTLEQMVEEIRR